MHFATEVAEATEYRAASASLRKRLVRLRHLPFTFVPAMKIEAITQVDRLAGRDDEAPFVFRLAGVGRLAEGVRRMQSIRPHMPPRDAIGRPRIGEDRDADPLAVDGPVVVDPLGLLAPGRVVDRATAVDDPAPCFASTRIVLPTRTANIPFFGVANRQRPVGRPEPNAEVDPPRIGRGAKFKEPLIMSDSFAAGVQPIVARPNHCGLVVAVESHKLAMGDGTDFVGAHDAWLRFVPEVAAIDSFVPEPDGTMMDVVDFFTRTASADGVRSRHLRSGRSVQRPQDRPRPRTFEIRA